VTRPLTEAGGTAAAPGAWPGRRDRQGPAWAWLYFAPALIALVVWVYGPLVFTGVLSVLNWNLVSANPTFAGLGNYRRLADPDSLNAVRNTAYYALGLLPFATAIPCALAILLWKRPGRVSGIYRALLFLPVVLAPVANAICWQFILDPLQGAVNAVGGHLGFGAVDWLGDSATALPTIVAITAPKVVALNTLLFGAALANIDRRTVEAARLDNASEREITLFVLVPQLLRTMALLGMLSLVTIWPWIFTNVAVLTQGGPDGATDNVYYRLYTLAFTFFDAGTASAAAVAICAALALLLGAYALIARRSRANG
jgi:multiple sugar transport system permease protein